MEHAIRPFNVDNNVWNIFYHFSFIIGVLDLRYHIMRHDNDCHRCCIASLLNKDYEDVPHFLEECENKASGEEFQKRVNKYLEQFGLFESVQFFLANENTLSDLLSWHCQKYGDIYYIVGVKGTLWNHSVLGFGDRIIWDPRAFIGAGTLHINNWQPCEEGDADKFWLISHLSLRIIE